MGRSTVWRSVVGFIPPRLPAWFVVAVLLVVPACSPIRNVAVTPRENPAPAHAEDTAPTAAEDVEELLRRESARWKGTPHVLGGTTTRGIDCSAFVQRVYSEAFDIDLPRTTELQVVTGMEVPRSDLRPGDLVFFRLPTKTRHVGIYVNDGEFVHASSSSGVTVSQIDHRYWRETYWTSRRVLPENPAAHSTASVNQVEAEVETAEMPKDTYREPSSEKSEKPKAASPPRRVGW